MQYQVKVPASSANLGSGVDTLGIALNKYLTIQFELSEHFDFRFGDGFDKEITEKDNLVLTSLQFMADRLNINIPPISFLMSSEIPQSRGLGSSSSAIIAGLLIGNTIFQSQYNEEQILGMATEIEGHPDNVAPALLGGFTMTMSDGGHLLYHKYPVSGLQCVVMIPDYPLSTHYAREVLPKNVSLSDAVHQIQRASLLTEAFIRSDFSHLDELTKDSLFTPYRSSLIKEYDQITSVMVKAGAKTGLISGAGPTVIALTTDNASKIKSDVEELMVQLHLQGQVEILNIDNTGAVVTPLKKDGKDTCNI